MSRMYDKPITIQIIDELTEKWTDLYKVHAKINKTRTYSEYMSAGAIQSKATLTFEIRYFKALDDIRLNTQSYRVVYENAPYNIEDYDDFMESHKTVKLLGTSANV